MSFVVLLSLSAILLALFWTVRPQLFVDRPKGADAEFLRSLGGWWVGLALGLGGIAAIGAAMASSDAAFSLFAVLAAVFGTGMAAHELGRRLRRARRAV